MKTSGLTTPNASPVTPSEPHKVHAIRGWRRLALMPLGWFVRLWGASLRFEVSPESLKNLTKIDEPVAFVVWHNRLFITTEIFRRYRQGRPIYALVSASKDGSWLDAFFSLVGMHTVRGSSSRLGREAVTSLVTVMREGNDIAITPDGPRGPRYDFKAGGLIVARRAHAPILLIGGKYDSAWQLRSWDGFYLPKPFSCVHLCCELVHNSELADRDTSAEQLRVRMLAMNPDKQ
jgi:lysophospholipid acyltransferase (LPLAT)-like uncharacterized protein